MFPTLLGITALVFFVMGLSPGGIGGVALDKYGNINSAHAEQVREYYNRRYGIDKPLIVQYARWLNEISPLGFVHHDDGTFGPIRFKTPGLGDSLDQNRPVSDMILESLPLTLLLNGISIPIIYLMGILVGIKAARNRGGAFDNISGGIQLAQWSIPTIWAGVMLIGLLANKEYVRWFPTSGLHETDALHMHFLPWNGTGGFQRGYLLDTIWHLVLPVVCMTYGGGAFLTKLTRGSLLENLGSDYTRTARAKGLDENTILYRHVFRNSTLALITVAAGILPGLLGGSIVVESIFSIPGMGRLGVQAVQARDREVVLAVTLIGGFIGLVSTIVRDVLYAMADPRVSYA